MNQVSEEQAKAALAAAGIEPLDAPEAIATSVSALLASTAKAFASLPFEAEPCGFAVVQAREKS